MDFQEAMDKRTKQYEDIQRLQEVNAKGAAFEDLTEFYLKTAWKSRGAKVWKWNEPNPLNLNGKKKDTGCDLVIQTEDGQFYLVQCKNHPKSGLDKDADHLANIFEIAAENDISPKGHIVFAYIAKSVSRYADDTMEVAGIRITEDDFEDPDFDWAPMFGGKKRKPKELRGYQEDAIKACIEGFKAEEEGGKPQIGKLIMACGTGKTLTSLGLVRELSQGNPYSVLFLAPSIALVSQTFRSWDSEEDIAPIIVCSDATANKKRKKSEDDEIDESASDIPFPVSANADEISCSWDVAQKYSNLRVVFSTYQSIEAVKEFQEKSGVKFDLTICDEAHRTATEENSLFSQAVDPKCINTGKKLFMTATPKIYKIRSEEGKKSVSTSGYVPEAWYSMDDEEKYGPEFYRYSFRDAIKAGWLCDYKVLILAMRKGSERNIDDIEKMLSSSRTGKDGLKELECHLKELISKAKRAKSKSGKSRAVTNLQKFVKELETLTGKVQGAYIDLSDLEASSEGEVADDFGGMVSLRMVEEGRVQNLRTPVFARSAIGFATTITHSKFIRQNFEDFYGRENGGGKAVQGPEVACRHIDGTMSSNDRLTDLIWLKEAQKTDEIRLLSNAQCLSEGIDVPSLDAVVFFEKRTSQIGIIQAAGRVMRKVPGKKYGYIILPIMLDGTQSADDALKGSEFETIWQVIQALRSVDEGMDAIINTLALRREAEKRKKNKKQSPEASENPVQPELPFEFDRKLQEGIVSHIVDNCGDIAWKRWVNVISGSVKDMIGEIGELSDTPEIKPKFEEFRESLSKTLHKEQSKEDAVNLIAQFIVTRPVFSALFPASDFDSNPISRALEGIADDFKDAYSAYDKELDEFQSSIEQYTETVAKDSEARKELVRNFYEEFYQKVFPKEADANGVYYTPEPVVDFMIKETDRLLEKNFGKRLQDEGIQILDPFSGTGTFVTRLLDKDLGVIDDEHVKEKYQKEIWSNEIMPTAYYISTLNVEDAMKQRTGEAISFPGAVLTDTFRISEAKGMLDASLFSGNSDRENSEEDRKISVIISNPPYSAHQDNANGNNRHVRYEVVDNRIDSTYKALQDSTNPLALYDSYVRAFRWASDRLNGKGIVSFITNAGWLRSSVGAGIRRCFINEFNDIYVYDLRGNANLNDSKEGKSIFDIKTPVAITFLVKNPESDHMGCIHYISTPDFSTKEEKLELLEEAKEKEPDWGSLTMDGFGDWFDYRDASLYSLLPMGITPKKNKTGSEIFSIWSGGITTGQDPWLYSFSKEDLLDNVETFEDFFNEELPRWSEWKANGGKGKAEYVAKNVVRQDPTKIKWSREICRLLDRGISLETDSSCIRTALYRPFTKKYLYFYFDQHLLDDTARQPDLFPKSDSSNLEICVAGVGSHSFSCLMTNTLPDVHVLESRTQCFPLYRYGKNRFGIEEYERKSAITDQALKMFREVSGDTLNSDPNKAKEQIFYYIYGLLHSKEYREKYQDTLGKDLPRIPFSSHFKEFETAGRELAAFHVGYEEAPKCEDVLQVGEPKGEISKMRLDKDRGVLTVNRSLSFKNIPKEAFNYVVNGKGKTPFSPLAWIVNQYQITVDKGKKKEPGSQIVSNPNDSPISDIYYVADLIPRLVTVSVKTQEIVNSLPSIERITSMDSEIERIWGRK